MNVKLMSLGLDITPQNQQAYEKIEQFANKYYKSEEKFNQCKSQKAFITQLSKSVEEDDVIILTTETSLYGPFKSFLSKAFNLTKKRNKKIITVLKSTYPELKGDLKEFKSQSAIPLGSVPLLSQDGKYSGFVIKSNKKVVLVLPLDANRLDYILDVEFVEYLEQQFPNIIEGSKNINDTPAYDFNMIKETVELMEKNGLFFSVASTKTVDFINEISKNGVDLSKVAVQSNYTEIKSEKLPREYAINLAKGAKDKLKAPLGVAITNVFTSNSKSNKQEMFLYICVADENEANALKIFAKKDETLPHFVMSAINEMFLMVFSWADTGSVFPPHEEKLINKVQKEVNTESKKEKIKLKVVVSILLILSIISSIIVVTMFNDIYNIRGSLAEKASITACAFAQDKLENKDNNNENEHGGLELDAVFIDDLNKNSDLEEKSQKEKTTQTTTTTTKKSKLQSTKKQTTTTTKKPTEQKGPYPETLVLGGENVETAQAIARIVQAEMGSIFHSEALKAQAVAIFTYVKYNNWKTNGLSKSSYCSTKVLNAVKSVLGQTVTYNGRTALTAFFAMSAGKTVPSNTVWNINHSIAYLAGGVNSLEGNTVSSYKTVKTYSSQELKEKIESSLEVTLGEDKLGWIRINSHDACVDANTGYVSSMAVGGKNINGHKFRVSVLGYGIRSHCFNISYDSPTDTFTFTVYGYGHGIGLSQRGANYYAKQGWGYKRILTHYYIGTVVK